MLYVLAMLTMLIDHIGLVFFKEYEFLRMIGRIAFPLYAFFLVQGYKYTSDFKKYSYRLFLLACISQFPYMLALDAIRLNVIFTLFFSLLIMRFIDTKKLLLVGISVIPILISDYGLYGLFLILVYRYFSGRKLIVSHFTLNLLNPFGSIQMLSIFATVCIVHRNKFKDIQINKVFYRLFYPVHLILIFLARAFLNLP